MDLRLGSQVNNQIHSILVGSSQAHLTPSDNFHQQDGQMSNLIDSQLFSVPSVTQSCESPSRNATYQPQNQLNGFQDSKIIELPPGKVGPTLILGTEQPPPYFQPQSPLGSKVDGFDLNHWRHQRSSVTNDQPRQAHTRSLSLTPQHFPRDISGRSREEFRRVTSSPTDRAPYSQYTSHPNGMHGSFENQLSKKTFEPTTVQHSARAQAFSHPENQQSFLDFGATMDIDMVNSQNHFESIMYPETAAMKDSSYINDPGGSSQHSLVSQSQSMIANGGSFTSIQTEAGPSNLQNDLQRQMHDPIFEEHNGRDICQPKMQGSISSNGVKPSRIYSTETREMNPKSPLGSFDNVRKRRASPTSIRRGRRKLAYVASPLGDGYYSASSDMKTDDTSSYIVAKQEQEIKVLKAQLAAQSTSQSSENWSSSTPYQSFDFKPTTLNGGLSSSGEFYILPISEVVLTHHLSIQRLAIPMVNFNLA
jgi:hypothetical protein